MKSLENMKMVNLLRENREATFEKQERLAKNKAKKYQSLLLIHKKHL